MQSEGFKSHYLFDNATRCCETWWVAFHFIIAAPHCLDCSHLSSNLLALQVSGTTRLSRQWARCKSRDRRWTVAQPAILHGQLLFPDFNQNNCGFGRDYPAWMGHKSYEKYYLFRQGDECCSKYFPTVSNCPNEHTEQTGYYWTSYANDTANSDPIPIINGHTYYPDLASSTCVNGWVFSFVNFVALLVGSH